MQLLELWPMAKLVLKQSVKAHGPLVKYKASLEASTEYWAAPPYLFVKWSCLMINVRANEILLYIGSA